MASFKRLANKAANDYASAITAVCALRRIGNRKQIETLIDAINRMYQNQAIMIDEFSLLDEENEADIQIPDFMLNNRIS